MADPNVSLLSPGIGRPKAAALYQVGLARLQLGDVRGAYEDLKEAARLEPQNTQIWQKYEETYALVESEIAQEHAAEQQAARHRQAQPGGPESGGRQEYLGPPPRFTLVDPNEASLQPLQTVAESADAEAQDRALALQAGMLRGVLAGGREVHLGGSHDQVRGQGTGNGRGRAMTEGEDREDVGTRYRADVEFQAVNPRLFIGICLCWITILCNGYIHYSYKHNVLPNKSAIFLQVVAMVVVCCLFAWLSWRCLKTNRAFRMSLSDGIKVLCCIIIQFCVCYFYISAGDRPNAPGATSLRVAVDRMAGTTADFLGKGSGLRT